jgi:hypothetical protein
LILIAQLEHKSLNDELTLQKLWFYVQSSMHSMKRLDRLCSDIEKSETSSSTVRNSRAPLSSKPQSGSALGLMPPIGGALLNVILNAISREG